jgi:glutathione S-transferase
MTELERRFPVPRLIPVGRGREIETLLRDQDDLHLDLTTLTFRFVRPYTAPFKSAESLRRYRDGGTGTVLGKSDPNKLREIEFWETAAAGISDAAAKTSARRFKDAFDGLEGRLADATYLLGRDITIVDIAWFINVNRLTLVGYPLERLHPRVHAWFTALRELPKFAQEVERPPEVLSAIRAYQQDLARSGKALTHVAGFAT